MLIELPNKEWINPEKVVWCCAREKYLSVSDETPDRVEICLSAEVPRIFIPINCKSFKEAKKKQKEIALLINSALIDKETTT